ncbi:hypothetical protein COM47_20655 [Bacillus wiedmannii]|nr:hypothetical protein COM47_20655 [Bacillus wiedmannii]
MLDIGDFQLKCLKRKDLDLILKWRNTKEIRSVMYDDHQITIDEHLKWYEKLVMDDTKVARLLTYKEKPIGFVNFTKIDEMNQTCYWGFYIGEKEGVRRAGTVLGLLALDYIFETKGIHKVCAEIIESNRISLNFHQKLGFQEDGRYENYICRDNDYIDVITMTLFHEQWTERKEVIKKELEGEKMSNIYIGGREIGDSLPPFIIAEMSGNHNQSLDRALQIVEAAAVAGAQGFKIQTYTPDTMTLNIENGDFLIQDTKSLWKGKSLYHLYKEAYTPWEWHKPIFDRCIELGMIPFSTPFDETAVDFLESLNVSCYKIASFENTDIPLIRKVAATGKPIIISTGMASIAELDETVRAAREEGCKELILLKCTSTYPASPKSTNIATIPHMKELFKCEIGLSDHTLGVGVSVASVALGATVIEKHLTLSRSDGGVDADFSMEPAEFRLLVSETEKAWESLGNVYYGPTNLEKDSLKFRRSLYVVEDIKAGEVFTNENIKAIRPGNGLLPKHLSKIIGKKASKDIKKGTPISWDLI